MPDAEPVPAPVICPRFWYGDYVTRHYPPSSELHRRVVNTYQDLLNEAGVVDLVLRSLNHSSGAEHKTLRGYNAMGWPSFSIHLEAGRKRDAVWLFSVDETLRKRDDRPDVMRQDIKLIRIYYTEQHTNTNFKREMNTPIVGHTFPVQLAAHSR
ncbi:hypothetical protein Hypma_008522 [Hypsizygus marmoreus]|uniref:Uncharacterized protein n=1 Tax=Hypsizygus marmoreus TaxID=39966 RepID=A0A369JVI1_HYPMA|nr:hypothetical protein Hypma_008522 [Hypsizygus marmoreus]